MFMRFPVPEFNRDELKDMEWQAPTFLSESEIGDLIERQKAGDASAYGCYAVLPDDALFDKFAIRGDHRHAVMCVLPDADVHVLGRSVAWAIQHVWIVDSLDAGSCNVVADWKTTRPMNTRLGPEDGITVGGGVLYSLHANAFADHWIGNRTILDNDWDGGDAAHGFRVLSAHDEDIDDFHDCNLQFQWSD